MLETVAAEKKEMLALLVAAEGMTAKEAAEDPRLNIGVGTAYRWLGETAVKMQIQGILRENKRKVQILASKHIEDALTILVKAMNSPAFTPTQRAAAKDILQFAIGGDAAEVGGTIFHVEVNTTLPDDAVQAQQARQRKLANVAHRAAEAIDVPFEVIDDETPG
jgi:hypothetical protein